MKWETKGTVQIQRDVRIADWWLKFEDGDAIRQSHLSENSPLRRPASLDSLTRALEAQGFQVEVLDPIR